MERDLILRPLDEFPGLRATALRRLSFLLGQVVSPQEILELALEELQPVDTEVPADALLDLRAACKGRYEYHWLAALLSTPEPQDDKQLAGFRHLAGAVLYAALRLTAKDRGHESSAKERCDHVRLVGRPSEAKILTTLAQSNTVAKVKKHVEAAERRKRLRPIVADRFASFRFLFQQFQHDRRPIKRRQVGREVQQQGSAPDRATEIPGPDAQNPAASTAGGADENSLGGGSRGEETGQHRTRRALPLAEWDEDLSQPPLYDEIASTTGPLHPVDNPELQPGRFEIDFQDHESPRDLGTFARVQHRRTRLASSLSRQMGLLCHTGVLTDFEIEKLRELGLNARSDLSNAKSCAAYAVLLSALIAVTPTQLLEMLKDLAAPSASWRHDVRLAQSNGQFVLRRGEADECRAIEGKGASLVAEAPEPVELCLPAEQREAIQRLANAACQSIFGPADISGALTTLAKGCMRTFREADVQNLLRDVLRRAQTDEAIAGHIVGDRARTATAMHYASVTAEQLQASYNRGLSAILGEEVATPALRPEARVGSPVSLEPDLVKKLYVAMAEELKTERHNLTSDTVIAFHNLYVSFVTASFSLMSGYRPVRNPFERIGDFNRKRRLLYICDKNIPSVQGGRYIPVPDLFEKQLNLFERHLEALVAWVPSQEQVAKACGRALSNEGPLLFTIKPDDSSSIVSAIRPAFQKETFGSGDIWPLPLNWGRHTMRTQLGPLRRELINAFMGHANPGAEPFAHHSGLAMADLEILRKKLDVICTSLGVAALEGLR